MERTAIVSQAAEGPQEAGHPVPVNPIPNEELRKLQKREGKTLGQVVSDLVAEALALRATRRRSRAEELQMDPETDGGTHRHRRQGGSRRSDGSRTGRSSP